MKIAKEKVWADAKGKLVKDGDDSASILVAAKGQEVADKDVEQYKNADEFFESANQPAAAEEHKHKKTTHK